MPAQTDDRPATIYARISLDADGERAGVQRQEQECRELCERNGWPVGAVLIDNSVSATSGANRPAFDQLLASKPERIVVWHLDRLVRLTADLERVLELGVDVHTVSAGDLDLSNPTGRAVARTVTAWSTYEGEQKASRQRAAHRQRRAAGRPFWTRRPFGYAKDGSLIEAEAAVLRQAYTDILAGASITGIARDWTERGIRTTPTRSIPEGKPFRATSVRQLVLHPRNIGKVTRSSKSGPPEETDQLGNWDPLIDEQTFRAVQRALNAPGRRQAASTKRKGLLTGLLHCGACDTAMRLQNQHTRGKVYRYYACATRCNAWPVEWLEDHLTETALALLASPSFHPAGDSQDDGESKGLAAEAARLSQLVDELLEDRREGLLSRAQWRAQHEATTDRLGKVQARLDELQAAASGGQLGELDRAGLLRLWHDESRGQDGRRELLRHLFGEITCQPRGRVKGEPSRELLAFERNGWANVVGLRVIEQSS